MKRHSFLLKILDGYDRGLCAARKQTIIFSKSDDCSISDQIKGGLGDGGK